MSAYVRHLLASDERRVVAGGDDLVCLEVPTPLLLADLGGAFAAREGVPFRGDAALDPMRDPFIDPYWDVVAVVLVPIDEHVR